METIAFILYILIFYPGQTGFDKEMYPIQAPICKVVDGVSQEDESCGLRYCLKKGRIRAAVLSGAVPGVGFGLICKKADGTEEATEGSEPSPGHGGMNWR
jgi:hypothetical protein